MKCRILVFTRHTPLPWEDGAGSYLFDILAFLKAAGCEIHVAWLAPHDHLRWQGVWTVPPFFNDALSLHLRHSLRFGRRYWFPETYWLPAKARLLDLIKQLLQTCGIMQRPHKHDEVNTTMRDVVKKDHKWMSLPTGEERAYATIVAGRVMPHFVIASYPWMIPLLDVVGFPVRKRICLHYDIAWQRAELSAQISGGIPEITRAGEAQLLACSDLIVDISECDREEVRGMVPSARTLIVPKGMTGKPVPDPHNQIALFVGSANAFNAEGLEWLLNNVWPVVRTTHPEAQLHVCGSINRLFASNFAGVKFFGVAQDISKRYAEATVVVIPLKRATGQNIKMVEAAAYGKPIIATSIAIHSVPELSEAIVCVDDPNCFADAIIRLFRSPSEREGLANMAVQAIKTHFNRNKCYGPLLNWLRQALED